MLITLSNAKELVEKGGIIIIDPVYKTIPRKLWFIPLPSRKFFITYQDIEVELSDGTIILIEKGFETDFSSVPQFLWGIFPPYGPFLLASIIHDWLYKNNSHKTNKHNFTQSRADKEMLIWSEVLCQNKIDNRLRLWGVRIGGKSWWNPKR